MGLNAVLIYGPGSNCQRELAVACELVGMEPNLHHISEAIADPSVIDRADFLAFPGGFTYADHAGSGVLMANQVRLHLLPAIRRHVDRSKLVFGVCNGFQMLVKAGLLPGPPYGRGAATLTFNDSGRYECRWVLVTPNLDNPGPWVQGLPIAQPIPIGHGEGKFVCP
ncbi:MAG TPA: phosphoribosylformylglycinamidine synthase subunit PurQ, partial [bacterium]|nr:phosphoribosylformylglycinamidine synthase subunit PurQ [bacterium]